MRHAVIMGLLGVAQGYLAFQWPPASYLLFWSAGSFVLVALAYGTAGPRILGKRADGSIAWWAIALLLPFFVFTWALWHVQRALTREPPYAEVAPGLWIGRRPLRGELPPGTSLVVDMTSEFPVARGVCGARSYRCLPTLDAWVPKPRAFREMVEAIARWEGGVYVHCAQGHGRSAAVVAAVLVAKGIARDISDAEAKLRAVRPLMRFSGAQRRLLEEARWLAREGAPSDGGG